MAYSKQTWNDGSSGGTPLSAARLQHMEDGIAAAVTVDGGGAAVGQLVAVTGVSPTTFGLADTAEITPGDIGAQPADADLTAIANLAPANGDLLQRVSGAWTNRTIAQVKSDLGVAADISAAVNAKAFARPNPATGQYFFTASAATGTSAALGNGSLRLQPWIVDKALTIDRLGAEVATVGEAGSKFRLGIYSDTGGCYPGALLLDAGQINGDSATVQALTVSLTLQPGLYWVGGAIQAAATTSPTMRTLQNWTSPVSFAVGTSLPSSGATGSNCYVQDSVTGALPASFATTPSNISGLPPRILVRAA